MRIAALFLAFQVGAALPAAAQQGDPTVTFATGDQMMNTAIEQAQMSLPLFLCETVNEEGYGPDGGFLKVSVPVSGVEVQNEIIWVGPFAAWDNENFAGILANQPNAMPGFNRGDQFDFTYDMIVDWSWSHPTGTVYGHYTTRVIYTQQGQTDQLAGFATPPFEKTWSCE